MEHIIYDREDNYIVSAKWDFENLRVTLQDGRLITVPGEWITWLKNYPASVRNNFTVYQWSIEWPDVNEGLSLETILLGRPKPLPAEEMTDVEPEPSMIRSLTLPQSDWDKIKQLAERGNISLSRWMQNAAIEKAARENVRIKGAMQHGGKRR